jgi:hypothetical protein
MESDASSLFRCTTQFASFHRVNFDDFEIADFQP